MASDRNTDSNADARLARLTCLDPATATPAVELIDTALAFVGADPTYGQLWLPWARYAYRAARQLPTAGYDRVVAATRTYAETLRGEGHRQQAIGIWQELLGMRGQPADPADIEDRVALAADLHAVGRCGQALREIGDALTHARNQHSQQLGLVVSCTVVYQAMLTACRRNGDATRVRAGLPDVYQPGRPRYRLLVTDYLPGLEDHHDVCAVRLDALIDHAPAAPPGQRRAVLARLTADMNPGHCCGGPCEGGQS
ncbi:hypothetical protein [Paractinoplanes hotanensis]|uniref:Uncharacterized protein n=1 Tax=Paractinoplanes hotanensis TaxID=2906497 RepID=A0ABT0XWX2_9ACTN|nr:hypothetical protein [Actinoplanes hotanensis]MCM4078295.1 hypothetical protein [Actinoplanes hotanensis]